ncbi:MAG: alpha/beta hydrolase [Actinomycetota bacterium]
MNAPLLVALSDGLALRGWTVLRFNFRGIGRSEGRPSLGREEVADAAGALSYLRADGAEVPVAIAGWSFGAAVAVRAATLDENLHACIAIAPPIKERPGITEALPRPVDLKVRAKLLVVCGDNDELVVPRDCRTWADYVAGAKHVALPGANHFFWAKYDDLLQVVTEFLETSI